MARQIDLITHQPESWKCIWRPCLGLVSHRWSQWYLTLSRLHPWNTWEQWAEVHYKHKEQGGASDCLDPDGVGGGVNRQSCPLNDLHQKSVTSPEPVGCFLHRMLSISVTTNCIISFSGGDYGRQADCHVKWIFLFLAWWQFSAWSVTLKIISLRMVVFLSWRWIGNTLKCRSNVMSE